MLFVQIITLIILIIILIEDMRSRAVHWYWFPLLAIAFSFLNYTYQHSFSQLLETFLFNLGFISVLFILLTVYFSFRHKKLVNITHGLLGTGDILFWLVAGCYLSLLNFMAFYIMSTIVILVGWLLYQQLTLASAKRIPLAGLQAIILAGLLTLSWFKIIPELNTDDHLANLILQWS